MAGIKATLRGGEAELDHLAGLLTETLDPPPAVSTMETPQGWLLEVYFEELPGDVALAHLRQEAPGNASLIEAMRFEELPDEDWVALTQQGLHPVEAGRFLIHGSHDRDRAHGRRGAIEIEAGQAFGTAHHGTTRGCLMMIDRLAKRLRMRRMLDLGTGSGILAIAATKSLCDNVLATDIDPIAIRVAGENIALNGAGHSVKAVTAADLKHPAIAQRAPYDLVMANILAGPLIQLASGIREIVAPGGHLILSGLLDHQATPLSAHYRAHGFISVSSLSLEGWATVYCRRR